MKHRRRIIALLLGAFLLSSCGDDGLKKGFKPPGPDDPDYGDGIPIRPGDTFWYMFTRTYRPDQSTCTGGQGLVCGEKQSSGHLCLRVTTVEDTETEDYASAPETVINARAKVVGTSAGNDDIAVEDQSAGTADPNVVDAATEPLWIKQLTMPSRNHGLLSPTEKAFSTRESPVPDNQELAHLPFFDIRTSSKWDWGGWDRTNDDCESLYTNEDDCPDTCMWDPSGGVCMNKAKNYLNGILSYFIREYGTAYYIDIDMFDEYHPMSAGCADHENPTDCGMAQCYWDWDTEECIVDYTIDVRWRYNLTTGEADLQGPVLHRVELRFNDNGALRSADETIIPDPNPGAPDRSDFSLLTEALESQPAATGTIRSYPDPWADAYCTF